MTRWALAIGIIGLGGSVVGCGNVGGPVRPSPSAVTPPPPPATFRGVVREAGGGPLAGVTVSAFGRQAAGGANTDAQGTFEFWGAVRDGISFQKPDYQMAVWRPGRGPGDAITIYLQRILNLTPGAPLQAEVFPDDPTYSPEDEILFWVAPFECKPCRYVEVHPALAGGSRLRLRWTGEVPLELLAGEYYGNEPRPLQVNQIDQTELLVTVPGRIDIILVGPAARNGLRPTLAAPVEFTLSVE